MKIVPIHFGQSEEDRAIVDTLTNTEGVLVRGVTEESARATVEILREYDNPDAEFEPLVEDLPTLNHGEGRVQWSGYVITYHTGLGYLSFDRVVGD